MIWLALAVLALVALAPLAWVAGRTARARGRRDAAMALHRAQLAELDRDLADGRLLPAEHAAAMLEVQRRLLAAGEAEDGAAVRADRGPLVLTLVLVPLAALGLYFVSSGAPGLPAAPLRARLVQAEAQAKQDQLLIDQLRSHLAALDPASPQARQGYVLLGNVEAARRNMGAAAQAWSTALAAQFDPTLAVETAEATAEAAGRVTDASAALFRRALDAAPADAPWRPMAERRLTELGQKVSPVPR